MRHRRREVSTRLTTLLVALLCCATQVGLLAENCRFIHSADNIRTGGYVGADGKVHYTINYDAGVSNDHIAAFQMAINKWNAVSNTTGIVLEETTGNPDFWISRNNQSIYPGCAKYEAGQNRIWYSHPYMPSPVYYPDLVARVYAHELGHALGLQHKGGTSIMNEPPPNTPTCYDAAELLPSEVQVGDAWDANSCERAAHSGTPYGPPPRYFWESWSGSCQTIWLTEEYWICPDRCFLDFLIDIPWYTTC